MINSVSQASSAYARTLSELNSASDELNASTQGSDGGTDFGTMLKNMVGNAINTGHEAEDMTAQGLQGSGDMTKIVTAVSDAQLALQTTTAVRDRLVQAYQNVMQMTI